MNSMIATSAPGARRVQWLFCENQTNRPKLDGQPAPGPFKDGINDYVVGGVESAIRRDAGTKVAAHFTLELAGQESKTLYLRFAPVDSPDVNARKLFEQRRQEADDFYAVLQQGLTDDDARNVQRQALAGLLWSKQLYYFDVNQWLDGDPAQPAPPPERCTSAIPIGGTCPTSTSSPCPTLGSTRGTPPGIKASRQWPSR